jgi:hypothetical protein
MARPRAKPEPEPEPEVQEITAEQVGSWDPDAANISHAVAVPGEYPEEHEDASDEWKAAFDHAARHKNPVSACVRWADAHAHEELVDDPVALKAEIERLNRELANK